jgi:hypothetical protein
VQLDNGWLKPGRKLSVMVQMLPIEIELETSFATPSQASEVLQKIGEHPPHPLSPSSTEWDTSHDHRRVAAELLLANLALERFRQLFARGLWLEASAGRISDDDAWFRRDSGRLELKENWLQKFLDGVRENPEPSDTGLEIGVEILQITFSSPVRVRAGIWVKVKTAARVVERAVSFGADLVTLATPVIGALALSTLSSINPLPAHPAPPPAPISAPAQPSTPPDVCAVKYWQEVAGPSAAPAAAPAPAPTRPERRPRRPTRR